MNKREAWLALAAGLLVLLVVGRAGVNRIGALKQERLQRLHAIQSEIRDRQFEVARGEQAATRLARWRQKSLPADRQVAMGLYKEWLHNKLSECQLAEVNVTSHASAAPPDLQQQLTLTVDGRGTLAEFSKFLYGFYRADHLHKIRSLRLAPVKDSDQLEIHLVIEALVLPGADGRDALASTVSNRLKMAKMEDYTRTIVGRNLFAAYDAARAKSDVSAPNQEEVARQIYVTGFFDNGHQSQVWLNVRTTGRTLKLLEGDSFQVDRLRGTIASIDVGPREVVILTDGKRLRVGLGENLAEGK